MYNELTAVDIQKLKEELAYRKSLLDGLHDEVKRAKEFGDLSENDVYKTEKRELNANKSRICYLEKMIGTAVLISIDSPPDAVGLFDEVEIYYPEDDEYRTVRIVTTLRNDVLKDCISKESPFGKAILGHKVGDTITIEGNGGYTYPVEIRSIKKGTDDASLPISKY